MIGSDSLSLKLRIYTDEFITDLQQTRLKTFFVLTQNEEKGINPFTVESKITNGNWKCGGLLPDEVS